MAFPAIPTLIYDSSCGRCTRIALGLARWAGPERLALLSYLAPDALELHADLDFTRLRRSPWLVLPDGRLFSKAQAGTASLALRPGFAFVLPLLSLPLLRHLLQALYWLLAQRGPDCADCSKP